MFHSSVRGQRWFPYLITLVTFALVLTYAQASVQAAFMGQSGLIAFTSYRDGQGEIYLLDPATGVETRLTDDPGQDDAPSWSRDGSRIAFATTRHGNSEIYLMDADGQNLSRFTTHSANEIQPAWAPNSLEVAFVSDRNGNHDIFIALSNTSFPSQLTDDPADDMEPAWSRARADIAFATQRNGNWDIYRARMTTSGTPQTPITSHPADERNPNWSPDGRQVAYQSNRDGKWEIYIINSDGTGDRRLTHGPGDATNPVWSPDGAFILFERRQGSETQLFQVAVHGSQLEQVTTDPVSAAMGDWQAVTPTHNTVMTPDSAGNVGLHTAIVLDGNSQPIVAYVDESTKRLKVYHGGLNTITVIDQTVSQQSFEDVSIALDAMGHPIIAYFNGNLNTGQVRLAHCADPGCQTLHSLTGVIGGGSGNGLSMALDAAGRPVLTYYGLYSNAVYLMRCGDVGCTAGNVEHLVDQLADGLGTAVRVDSSDRPIMAYIADHTLVFARCGEATCSVGNTRAVLDDMGVFGGQSPLQLQLDAAENPIITYYYWDVDVPTSQLRLWRCGNPTCNSGNSRQMLDPVGWVGSRASLQLDSSGRPVVVFSSDGNSLDILRCGDITCAGGNTLTTIDVLDSYYNAMVLAPGDIPIISYYILDTQDLRLATCSTPTCRPVPGLHDPSPAISFPFSLP